MALRPFPGVMRACDRGAAGVSPPSSRRRRAAAAALGVGFGFASLREVVEQRGRARRAVAGARTRRSSPHPVALPLAGHEHPTARWDRRRGRHAAALRPPYVQDLLSRAIGRSACARSDKRCRERGPSVAGLIAGSARSSRRPSVPRINRISSSLVGGLAAAALRGDSRARWRVVLDELAGSRIGPRNTPKPLEEARHELARGRGATTPPASRSLLR